MSILKTIDKVRAIREGGYTERAHTIPHYGGYSVAGHSWNVATLLAILHPDPSKELILAGLWHDVHERWTGDIPGSIKWGFSNVLKEELKELEEVIETSLGINHVLNLPLEDLKWLKACDMLEFWLWSIGQKALGNKNAEEGEKNARYWFETQGGEVPKPIQDFIINYEWYRTSDRDGWKL